MEIKETLLKIDNDWINISSPPVSIYEELVKKGIIEDPLKFDNESKYMWVGNKTWDVKIRFRNKKKKLHNRIKIQSSPYAKIFINNRKYDIRNEFIDYIFDYNPVDNGYNEIEINFIPPTDIVQEDILKYGFVFSEISSVRPFIRKPQFAYGWDWGPYLPDFLIYKIEDVSYNFVYLKDFYFQTLSISEGVAKVLIILNFHVEKESKVKLTIAGYTGEFLINEVKQSIRWELQIKNPKLWFPMGYGEPYLYDLIIEYNDGEEDIISRKKVGILTKELVDNENHFYFKINGIDIWAKGYNWIPIHSFLTNIYNKERIMKLFDYVVESRANMLRIWGGGLYENEFFYEESAKRGIMIWQDFPFTCAEYPEHKEFIEEIKKETEMQLIQLRNYANLVLLCGNNENEWIYKNYNRRSMKGAIIFSKILPEQVKEYAPNIPYWRSSPWGREEKPNSQDRGDIHIWDFWHKFKNYDIFDKFKPLFVSEFGMQALPSDKTLDFIFPSGRQRYPFDYYLLLHNKHIDGQQRIAYYLEINKLRYTNFEEYSKLTQIFQGFILKYAIESFRLNGAKGALIWQLNDCWPVVSWSVIDFMLEPKLSFWLVKSAFNDYIVSGKNRSLYLHSLIDKKLKFTIETYSKENFKIKEMSIEIMAKPDINILLYELSDNEQIVKIYNDEYLNYYFVQEIEVSKRIKFLEEIINFFRDKNRS